MDAIKSVVEKVAPGLVDTATPPSEAQVTGLRAKYDAAGQSQVFTFWDSLSGSEKAALYTQLSEIDPERVNRIATETLNPAPAAEGDDKVEPLPAAQTASTIDASESQLQEWRTKGFELIGEGKVAVLLMAGGQGTRLGSSDPKGCFDIGLPSHKSLFQLQAERIRRVEVLAAKQAGKAAGEVVVPWYVMTSGPTRGPTEAFFEKNNYFGLKKENVIVFEQGVLPCLTNDAKIILESKGKVAVAPDGNGGLYRGMITSPVLSDLEKRGIEHVHAYCVDNCLVRVADPTFIGFSVAKNADIATKVVRKRAPEEPVGLIVLKGGKPGVVEYSEIDEALTKEVEEMGEEKGLLRYRAANIVNHYYHIRFLSKIPVWCDNLPHHIARKKIPYVDLESGETVKPSKPNGIKLEQFVFDVFPFISLDNFACLEVKREDEFSPLKNARGTGEDDPDTSKKDIMAQGRKWVEAAGAVVEGESKEESGVEVSPLVSYDGEGLEGFVKGKTLRAPVKIEADE
ncbi:UDP-N-acetylglucosamine pyrophosphorylase [Saitoella coloradoensis]